MISFITTISLFSFTTYALSPLEAIETYKKDIIASSRKTGTWASVTAAQLILESGNPLSKLATEGNNFFGIKWASAHIERYPGATSTSYSTKEHQGGNEITIMANFTHFPNVTDGITEHSVIWWNGCYEPELKILEDLNSSMDSFLREMSNGPYATDVNYYGKLRGTIDSNNLEELDKLAFPDGRKFCGFGDRKVGEFKYLNDGYNGSASSVGTLVDEANGASFLVVKEKDLEGMYPESFFLNDYKSIQLPSHEELSIKEKINLSKIKENISSQNSWNLWDTLRVLTVFVGLCTLVYAVVFIVGYLFDKSNNILELSLISILTFGYLRYSDEETETRGFVNKSRLFKIEAILFLVGFFLVGGGLFNFIIDLVWYVNNIVG